MKNIYLLYNSSLKEYYFSIAKDPYRDGWRKIVHEENLSNFMRLNVDPQRKSLLTLLNVQEGTVRKMENLFRDSKVLVKNKI